MYKTQSLDGHNKHLLCWSPLTYIYQFVDKFIFHFLTICNVLVSLQAVLNVLILVVLQLLPETQCLVKTTTNYIPVYGHYPEPKQIKKEHGLK